LNIQDQRIDFVLKAASKGYFITENAINELQAETHRDPMSVLDRILCASSVEKRAPVITVEHVRIAVWSFVMDELIRRKAISPSNEPLKEGTCDERS
jgi:UDP-3-O-acyl-N-acetylglucosamine deacetylase